MARHHLTARQMPAVGDGSGCDDGVGGGGLRASADPVTPSVCQPVQ